MRLSRAFNETRFEAAAPRLKRAFCARNCVSCRVGEGRGTDRSIDRSFDSPMDSMANPLTPALDSPAYTFRDKEVCIARCGRPRCAISTSLRTSTLSCVYARRSDFFFSFFFLPLIGYRSSATAPSAHNGGHKMHVKSRRISMSTSRPGAYFDYVQPEKYR